MERADEWERLIRPSAGGEQEVLTKREEESTEEREASQTDGGRKTRDFHTFISYPEGPAPPASNESPRRRRAGEGPAPSVGGRGEVGGGGGQQPQRKAPPAQWVYTPGRVTDLSPPSRHRRPDLI